MSFPSPSPQTASWDLVTAIPILSRGGSTVAALAWLWVTCFNY